jgi:hypothetical protein
MKSVRILVVLLTAVTITVALGQAPSPDGGFSGNPPQQESFKSVKLFPNPAIEYVSVKFETPQAKKVKFSVHNIIGSEMPLESEVIDDFEVHIKVKDFSTGVYLLSIKNDETGHKSAYKFLKK